MRPWLEDEGLGAKEAVFVHIDEVDNENGWTTVTITTWPEVTLDGSIVFDRDETDEIRLQLLNAFVDDYFDDNMTAGSAFAANGQAVLAFMFSKGSKIISPASLTEQYAVTKLVDVTDHVTEQVRKSFELAGL